jgi:single-strand DNA-binding protein
MNEMSLELHVLKGNVGKDADLAYTEVGLGRSQFSLAVSHGKKNKDTGEWENTTVWYNCTAWGQLAESVAEKVKKGQKITVVGNKLEARAYVSQQDGTPQVGLNLTLQSVDFVYERNEDSEDESHEDESEKKPKYSKKPATSKAEEPKKDKKVPF